jgi:hypothetical protein
MLRVKREEPCMIFVPTERNHAGALSQKRGTMHELRLKKEEPCRSFVSKKRNHAQALNQQRGTMQELSVKMAHRCTIWRYPYPRQQTAWTELFLRWDGKTKGFQDGGFGMDRYPRRRTTGIERFHDDRLLEFPRWRTY